MEPHLIDRYGSKEGAAAYRDKYRRSLSRRLSNAREMTIVDRALAQAGATGHVLDCPCGAGRLLPTLLRHATSVAAVDLSPTMVEEARTVMAGALEAGCLTTAVASVTQLPFNDNTFDTAVCHRLIHHLPGLEQRRAVYRELVRVTKRRVVMSFNDASTLKMRVQAKRGKKRRRIATTVEDLARETAAEGLVLEPPVRRLNGWFSLVAVGVFRVEGAAAPADTWDR